MLAVINPVHVFHGRLLGCKVKPGLDVAVKGGRERQSSAAEPEAPCNANGHREASLGASPSQLPSGHTAQAFRVPEHSGVLQNARRGRWSLLALKLERLLVVLAHCSGGCPPAEGGSKTVYVLL